MKVFTDCGYPPVSVSKGRAALRAVEWRLDEAVNIRRDTDEPQLWRPAGKPRCLCASPALPVFCFIPREGRGSQVTFWLSGLSLSYTVTSGGADIYGGTRRQLGALPGRPLDFVTAGNGVVKVLVEGAPAVYITYGADLSFVMAGAAPSLPEVGIGVADVQMMRQQVRGGKLSGASGGRSAGMLAAADNNLLVERASEAYSALKARAVAQGRFVQPVLARWRILDADGGTLMRGPWVYPSAVQGFQCTGAVSFASSDSLATVSDAVLQAQTYRLRLIGSLPQLPEPWRSVAARMVVEVTEEVEPSGTAGAVNPGYVDVDPQGVSSARVYLPGCSPEGAANQGLYRSRLVEALRGAARTSRVVQVIDKPFGGASVPASVSSHTAGVEAPDSGADGFAYTSALRAGAALFLANPARLGAPAIPGGCFAIADGRYSPLVTASDGADSFTSGSRILSLTPLAGTALAYSLTDDLAPHVEAPQVAATASGVPEEGTVHFVDTGADTSRPVASVTGAGHIVAMAQPPRAGSGWDFARTRLLLFGTDGIRLATFGAGGEMRACAPFDPRGVASAGDVCAGLAPGGGSCLYALAGGDLLCILPSRTDTLLRGCDARAVAWSGRFGELWLLYDDRLERMTRRGERIRVLADELSGYSDIVFGRFGGQTLVATADSLYTLEREDAPEVVRCRVRLMGEAPGMARSAELGVCGREVTGSVVLSGDNGSEVPEMLASFGLRGQVNAPVALPLRVPYRRRLTLEADLRLSPRSSVRLEVISSRGTS